MTLSVGVFPDLWGSLMARLSEAPKPYLKAELGIRTPTPIGLQFRPNTAFALMPIGDDESRAVFGALQQAFAVNGVSMSRADLQVGSDVILRGIVRDILQSEFLVVDLTHERPNVYFELGYAFGVGNRSENVLMLAKEGTRIHFDIGLLRIHNYRSVEHLKKILPVLTRQLIEQGRSSSIHSAWANRLRRLLGNLLG